MPQLDELIKNKNSKKFKKTAYRPWDLSGSQNSDSSKNTKQKTINTQELSIEAIDDIHKSQKLAIEGEKTNDSLQILEIDPYDIKRWTEKDRPENELGNVEDLAENFKAIGQQVPCIVRPISDPDYKYELIVGECRWHAAKIAQYKLKVIVKKLDDRMACLVQAVENEKRQDLSDFAKGMSYATKIEKGLIKQKDLTDILKISRQQVSRLLSYKRIPPVLFDAIGDFRKVSAYTAEEIYRLSQKGESYMNAIISLSEKIRLGKVGWQRIKKEVEENANSNNSDKILNRKVLSKDGRHLFTWRHDNNNAPSIHFPKNIIELFNKDIINLDEVSDELKECITRKLINI